MNYVRVGATDVTDAIREPSISAAVSAVATTLGARTELIRRQRELIAGTTAAWWSRAGTSPPSSRPTPRCGMLLTASEEATAAPPRHPVGRHPERRQLHEQVTGPRRQGFHRGELHRRPPTAWSPLDSSDLDFEQTVEAVLAVVRHAAH